MIRFAKLDDVKEIMNFIHNEWKNDHLLARDEAFFLYEFQDGDKINFVISEDSSYNINGILGFIPTSFSTKVDICTVMWKVTKGVSNPILGVNLLEFLLNYQDFRTVMSVGINEKTIGIYKFLGMYTDCLKHYVLVNQTIKNFNIAYFSKPLEPKSFYESEGYELVNLDGDTEFNFSKYASNILYKDSKYFIKRYLKHPVYEYKIFGISKDKLISSLIVTRVQEAEQSKVLRIVDFIGAESEFKYISKFLYQYLIENNFEYADFYCFGFERANLIDSAFDEVNQDGEEMIIPNYFSPFLKKNIKINFFTNTKDLKNLKLFKADGDQDRPN